MFAQEAFAGDAADLEAYAATLDPQAGADLNDILARIWEECKRRCFSGYVCARVTACTHDSSHVADDTDGDGVITADTTKHLIKAYLIKGKAFLPQYLSFVKEISAPSFIRTITVMGGDAVDQESIPVLKALVDEVSEVCVCE